jgi:hypothetical protein
MASSENSKTNTYTFSERHHNALAVGFNVDKKHQIYKQGIEFGNQKQEHSGKLAGLDVNRDYVREKTEYDN